jgi:hypothetical protein
LRKDFNIGEVSIAPIDGITIEIENLFILIFNI